jgi:heme-degrading monooxygenase HmoA
MRRCFLLFSILALAAAAGALGSDASLLPQPSASASPQLNPKRMIARIWQGRTLTAKADEYEKYLNATGVPQILKTQGNHGVEVLRRSDGAQTEFVVISYWESVAAIRKFAGPEWQKPHVLARDREFLIEPEPVVLHYEVARAGGK